MDLIHEKYGKLKKELESAGSVAVAFSGGVDSTFLLKTAHDVLGENVAAFTVRTVSFPEREYSFAEEFCKKEGIIQIVCRVDQLAVPEFRDNLPDRCYYCKKELFGIMQREAQSRGFRALAEGSNTDDDNDYRPGMRAVRELGCISPLKAAGLTKAEIRALSKEMNLPTWDKPSYACLASRFVYGEKITEEKLAMVGKAEDFLRDLGFRQLRVRVHGGDTARIEVAPEEFEKLFEMRERVAEGIKNAGFLYAAADLLGYRTGNMNASLKGE